MHNGPDHDRKHDGAHAPGNPQFGPQYLGCNDYCHDIDGGAGIQKRNGRAQARPAFVDPAEQRQHGTGADGQQAARDRGHTQGYGLRRLWPEMAQHRALADIHRHRTGNDKGRQQAQDDVLAGIPAGQPDRFEHCIVEAWLPRGQKINQQKNPDYHPH